jgi:hypothetical protein
MADRSIADVLAAAERVLSAYEMPRGPMSASDAALLARFVVKLLGRDFCRFATVATDTIGTTVQTTGRLTPNGLWSLAADLIRAAEQAEKGGG